MDLRICKCIWRDTLYWQNDDGEVVGLSDKDRKKLLEAIPNKITDTMGIVADEETRVDDIILMENLHLFDEEGYLIRAAMLAFYKDPEKWVTGSYIKIGYFGKSNADLKYQDEVHGSLIEQIDKTVDLVYTKYLKALIYYEGIQEQFMFP